MEGEKGMNVREVRPSEARRWRRVLRIQFGWRYAGKRTNLRGVERVSKVRKFDFWKQKSTFLEQTAQFLRKSEIRTLGVLQRKKKERGLLLQSSFNNAANEWA